MVAERLEGEPGDHMVFALDRDNGEVLVLPSPLDAPIHCKPIDVKDGFWLFFAGEGSPLEPLFESPEAGVDAIDVPGEFALDRAMSGLWLQERLDQVARVSGCGVGTIDALVETLKINRGKRVAADARRR
jgi:hypothetical protein